MVSQILEEVTSLEILILVLVSLVSSHLENRRRIFLRWLGGLWLLPRRRRTSLHSNWLGFWLNMLLLLDGLDDFDWLRRLLNRLVLFGRRTCVYSFRRRNCLTHFRLLFHLPLALSFRLLWPCFGNGLLLFVGRLLLDLLDDLVLVVLPEHRSLLPEGLAVVLVGVERVRLVGLGLLAAGEREVLALVEQRRDDLLLLEQAALVRLDLGLTERVLPDEPVVLRLQLLQFLLEALHLLVVGLLQRLQLVGDLASRQVDLLHLLLVEQFIAAVLVEDGLQLAQGLARHDNKRSDFKWWSIKI